MHDVFIDEGNKAAGKIIAARIARRLLGPKLYRRMAKVGLHRAFLEKARHDMQAAQQRCNGPRRRRIAVDAEAISDRSNFDEIWSA